MTAPPQKLYTRFVRRLLPLLVLTFILAAIGTAWVYYQSQQTEINRHRKQTLEVFAQALTKPLWDCDSITARGIIEALTLQPNVLGTSAPDQCAQQVMVVGIEPVPGRADTLSTELQYIDEFGNGHELGQLNIAFHHHSVFSAISKGMIRQIVIFLSMLAAVLVIALWTFKRTVSNPLEQLCKAMSSHRELDPVPAGWAREIIEVAQTYNAQVRDLRHQVLHDPLTGLGNRLLLEERLKLAILHARRMGTHGHVMLLDLDRFKQVNDAYGHAAGDEVLRTTARRLLECVRASDTVVRLGGDEFIIITADAPGSEDISALATRIKQQLAQAIHWKNISLHVTASVGIARFVRDGDSLAALMAHADADMYSHKQP